MKKLVEIAYFTDNVDQMANFYKNLLGLTPVAQSSDMAIFMIGETKLFIHRTYTPGEGDLPPDNHVAFGVENLEGACQALQQQGLTLEVEPQNYYWGRSAYLRDPDGHVIELTETTKDTRSDQND
jgi:catechol 2,3-dioxygenase-like lactoylglutathione lyase family enzyme